MLSLARYRRRKIRNRHSLDIIATGIYIFHIHQKRPMTNATPTKLLLTFRTKDTSTGVTRNTIQQLASQLDINETAVVHLALAKLAKETLPAYEPDDGPLTDQKVLVIQEKGKPLLPTGQIIARRSLFY